MANSILRPQGGIYDERDRVEYELPANSDLRRGIASALAGQSATFENNRALSAEASGDTAEFNALRAQAVRDQERAAMMAPRVRSLQDVNGVGDFVDYVQGGAPQAVVSTLPSLTGAVALRSFGRIPTIVGAAVPAYRQARGEIAGEQYSDPTMSQVPVEQRDTAATGGAVVSGALESIVPAGMARTFLRKPAGSYLSNLRNNMIGEAATETAQTYSKDLAHEYIDPTHQRNPWEYADSAVLGAVGGGVLSMGTNIPGGHHVPRVAGETIDNVTGAYGKARDTVAGAYGKARDTVTSARDRATAAVDSAKEGVDGVVDRVSKAAGEDGSRVRTDPRGFVRDVFRNSAEDAAADLRPDSEDPTLLLSHDPTVAIVQRDAARTERAARFAEELLNDPNVPSMVKDKIAELNGDYSTEGARSYVASVLLAQRSGEKLESAARGLEDFLSGVADAIPGAATDALSAAAGKVSRKNLMDLDPVELQPLTSLLASKLGPRASEAPTVAKQLVAASMRLGKDFKITDSVDRRLRSIAEGIDDDVLDAVTEATGSDNLRAALVRIRELPSATFDLRQSKGSSFLESMLQMEVSPGELKTVAEFIDSEGVKLKGMNATRRENVLKALTPVFGTPRNAQVVLEYYGNLRRAAIEKSQNADTDTEQEALDTLEATENYARENDPDATDNPDTTYEDTASAVEWGGLTENDGPESVYGFRQAASKLPFRKFAGEKLSNGRIRREATRGIVDERGTVDANYGYEDYAEYLGKQGITPEVGVTEYLASLDARIAESERKQKAGEDRTQHIAQLHGERTLLTTTVAEKGAKEALNSLYEVTTRAKRQDEDLTATDDDLRDMKRSAKPPNVSGMRGAERQRALDEHAATVLTFVGADGKELKLGTKSMVATQGTKRSKGFREATYMSDADTLKDAIASVVARGYRLKTDLKNVTLEPGGMKVFTRRDETRREALGAHTKRMAELRKTDNEALTRLEETIDAAGDPSRAGYREGLEAADEVLAEIESRTTAAEARAQEAADTKTEFLNQWQNGEAPKKGGMWAAYTAARARSDAAQDELRAARDTARAARDMMYWAGRSAEDLERSGVPGENEMAPDTTGVPREKYVPTKSTPNTSRRAYVKGGKRPAPYSPSVPKRGVARESARVDAILSANPELLTVLDASGEPKDPSWTMASMRERLVNQYAKIPTLTLKTKLEDLRKQYREASQSRLPGAKQDAETIKYIGELIKNVIRWREDTPGRSDAKTAGGGTWVRGSGKIKKNSFVGAKADPKGAAEAEASLAAGTPEDVVWSTLGWFRGPDGKLRKEIRSPILMARANDFLRRALSGYKLDGPVTVGDLIGGVPEFEKYMGTWVEGVAITPSLRPDAHGVSGYFVPSPDGGGEIHLNVATAQLTGIMDLIGVAETQTVLRNVPMSAFKSPDLGAVADVIFDVLRDHALKAGHSTDDIAGAVGKAFRDTLVHELQHVFQAAEGFDNGGNSETAVLSAYGDLDAYKAHRAAGNVDAMDEAIADAYRALVADIGPDGDIDDTARELYGKLVGEVEAEDVAARFDLSDEEARQIPPALKAASKPFLRSLVAGVTAYSISDKVRKKSFVGAKADPKGAAEAESFLNMGAPEDVVWHSLGWFRGPDGKLRKEVRSPVFKSRVKNLVDKMTGGDTESVLLKDLMAGVPEFENYKDTWLQYTDINPDGEYGLMTGNAGAFLMPGNSASGMFGENFIALSMPNIINGALTDLLGIDTVRGIIDAKREAMDPEYAALGLPPFATPEELNDALMERASKLSGVDIDAAIHKAVTDTLVHEIQHALQAVEGFENGGSPAGAVLATYGDIDEFNKAVEENDAETAKQVMDEAYQALMAHVGPDGDLEQIAQDLYESITGEVEANDVAARFDLSDEEARQTKPALSDASRVFVRSVISAVSLKQFASAVGKGDATNGPKVTPGDYKRVKEEIKRLRGDKVKVRIRKLIKDLGGSGDYTYDPVTGERIIEIAKNANLIGTARHEAIHDLMRFLSETPELRSLAKDLKAAAEAYHVREQLKKLLEGHPAALEQLSDPEERLAYMYQFWAEGQLTVGPNTNSIFGKILQFIRDVTGILLTSGQRGESLLNAFHKGHFADPSVVQEVMHDIAAKDGDLISNRIRRAAPQLDKITHAVMTSGVDRLRNLENDSMNRLADLFDQPNGSGFIQNRFQQQGRWDNKLERLLRGSTAVERRTAIEELQRGEPTSKLAVAIADFNDDIFEYMVNAGVKSVDEKGNKVPLHKVSKYFMRSWDPDAIARDVAGFTELLMAEGNMPIEKANEVTSTLVRGTEAHAGPSEGARGLDLGFTPYAPHTSERVLTFINDGNREAFAKYQHKDLADVMTQYVRSSVHRAEYARQFGNLGEKIVDLVAQSGLTGTDDLKTISNSIQALEGSLDPGKWSGSTKEVMAAIQTLQNVVLLPLSLVSQMVDPIILAARSEELSDAGAAFTTAIKRLKNTITRSDSKVDGEDLAEILGIVSNNSTLEAMAMAQPNMRMSKTVESINRMFFKYNGMQGWNNSMRIAATAAGERYILKYRTDKKRLAEIGLTPEDVKVVDKWAVKKGALEPAGDGLDVRSDKIQQALFKFVDQAVLRPSAAHRPVWMSDPRFLLVAHLKQFTFSMHNVVLKRATEQLDDGNLRPWAILMLAAPTILAADMTKMMLLGSSPPDWGYFDYLKHAVDRSGLMGIGDFGGQVFKGVDSGSAPGERLLGPTFENLMEILRWIGGDPRTDLGDVVDRTVPGARFV